MAELQPVESTPTTSGPRWLNCYVSSRAPRAPNSHTPCALGVQAGARKSVGAGYAALAASYTEDELDQRHVETASRRERAHQRYNGE
jgi:hypothetical protein